MFDVYAVVVIWKGGQTCPQETAFLKIALFVFKTTDFFPKMFGKFEISIVFFKWDKGWRYTYFKFCADLEWRFSIYKLKLLENIFEKKTLNGKKSDH